MKQDANTKHSALGLIVFFQRLNGVGVTRFRALILITLLWAGVYLPGLGEPELKGEEGRRILPAMAMLETGNWLVPHIGGEPYLRKPPLINWLIAGAIETTGMREEWSVRLPSVLAVWLLGVVIVWVVGAWLGAETGLLAALIALTHFAIMGKGRLAEIEAVYVAFSGMAMVFWMGWRGWPGAVGAGILLGLGMLTKGPVHLVFFAAVVWAGWTRIEKGWRHLGVALILACGAYALWWMPYREATAGMNVEEVIKGQTLGRFTGGWSVSGWLLNIPRALSDFLPWTIFAPLLFSARRIVFFNTFDAVWFRRLRWVCLVVFFGMLLMPAVLPRYVMPVFIPFAVLMAVALREASPRWRLGMGVWPFAVTTTAVMIAVTLIYAIFVTPELRKRDDLRPLGALVQSAMEKDEALIALDVGFEPMLFYVHNPVAYLRDEDDLPKNACKVLMQERTAGKVRKDGREVNSLKEWVRGEKKRFGLYLVGAAK